MDKYKVILDQDVGGVVLSLVLGASLVDKEYLTKSQDFDILLLKTLDIILSRNKIDRCAVKEVEITGSGQPQALSTMLLTVLKKGLEAE